MLAARPRIAKVTTNQHTDNENLRLGHLFKGIDTLAALMTFK
jgi:hypothetical protein